ncbi:MAG TPA: lipopolysaccharide heptosyltransferase I [Burkholderiales bacterium]|nr:lipopolysaccharide heptosyltransferase I [Burkholderiales bacterium]
MRRILLIKTSSMGDIVHNLPVASDLRAAFPGCRIDWVVENAFAAIPALHPAVGELLPVSLRRWRSRPFSAQTRREFGAFRRRLRSVRYDAVIDTQGLVKSALIAWMAQGPTHGFDWKSSREPLRVFYEKVHAVPWTIHAVERNRRLAADALGYAVDAPPAYGIAASAAGAAALDATFVAARAARFAVLLHATSARNKEWPEDRWVQLGSALAARGLASVLPFGNPAERQRSEQIAARIPGALVPPAMGLDALAALIARARIVVGVDTGLSHLAVALGRPTIGLYCATDPAATGLLGGAHVLNLGGIGGAPGAAQAIAAALQLLEAA